MQKITLATVSLLAVLASTGVANADGYRWWGSSTPGIDAREAQQAREIEQGRRRGQLSAREYNELRVEQARIHEMERRAKADGYVSPEERRRIRAVQEQAERHIQQDTHNRETASNVRPWYRRYY